MDNLIGQEMRAKAVIRTCLTISPELYSLGKQNGIKMSEALRIGMSLILAEKGIKEYDNRLNLVRNIELLKDKIMFLQKKGH